MSFSCMVAFMTDIRLVFRSSLGNQQIHFDCCQFQSDIECKISLSFLTWLFIFSRKLSFLWLIGNKTSCRPIRSVIILVTNKSDSRCAVVRFCYHSYDYRPNCTPLNPITITYCLILIFQCLCFCVLLGPLLKVKWTKFSIFLFVSPMCWLKAK